MISWFLLICSVKSEIWVEWKSSAIRVIDSDRLKEREKMQLRCRCVFPLPFKNAMEKALGMPMFGDKIYEDMWYESWRHFHTMLFKYCSENWFCSCESKYYYLMFTLLCNYNNAERKEESKKSKQILVSRDFRVKIIA